MTEPEQLKHLLAVAQVDWRHVPFALPPGHEVDITITQEHVPMVIGKDRLMEADVDVVTVTDGVFTAKRAMDTKPLDPDVFKSVARLIFEDDRRPLLVALEEQAYGENLLREALHD